MITMYMLIKRLKTISNNINVRLVPKVDFLDTLFTSISRLVPKVDFLDTLILLNNLLIFITSRISKSP